MLGVLGVLGVFCVFGELGALSPGVVITPLCATPPTPPPPPPRCGVKRRAKKCGTGPTFDTASGREPAGV